MRRCLILIFFFFILVTNHGQGPIPAAAVSHQTKKHFDYESFYQEELDKKHKDKSYRYFNNINRLAQKFPRAHTARVTDEVTVWCANDYLGMGRSPVLTDTMKYVSDTFSPFIFACKQILTLTI